MEYCALYGPFKSIEGICALLEAHLQKSRIIMDVDGAHLIITLPGKWFRKNQTMRITYREHKEYSRDQMLALKKLIQSIPLQFHQETIRGSLLQLIDESFIELNFQAVPGFSGIFHSLLLTLAKELNGFLVALPSKSFHHSDTQQFLDMNLQLILDMKGNSQLMTKSAVEKSYAFTNGDYFEVRTFTACLERAYALMILTAKAERIPDEKLMKSKRIYTFTAEERAFLLERKIGDQQRDSLLWQYEQLNGLLWAMGKSELGPASQICDVAELVRLMIKCPRSSFEKSGAMKSKRQILSELRAMIKMHEACQRSIEQSESELAFIPMVVHQRLLAFQWLIDRKYRF